MELQCPAEYADLRQARVRKALDEEILLKTCLRTFPNPDWLKVGNGDDAATVNFGDSNLVVSTDTLVEGSDFSLDYFSPKQVGIKAIETCVSDIVAMGARPVLVLLSLSVPERIDSTILTKLFDGVYESLERINACLVGGDVGRSPNDLVVSVTALGRLLKESSLVRSGARVGQGVYVSGQIGNASSGLSLLMESKDGFYGLKSAQLEPKCRCDIVESLAGCATACIDISDGFALDLHRMCEASGVGVVIDQCALPLSEDLLKAEGALPNSIWHYVLFGGEDYELIFTASKSASNIPGVLVGEIKEQAEGVKILRGGILEDLPRQGFDHFLNKSSKDFL